MKRYAPAFAPGRHDALLEQSAVEEAHVSPQPRRQEPRDESATQLVERILEYAAISRASDIHDDHIRPMIVERRDGATIRADAIRKGMKPIFQDGLAKAFLGETTLGEVFRVAL